jgi:serine/threonine protein kinase
MNPSQEVLDAGDNVEIFTEASDIYAFGMTVIEVYSEDVPFKNKKNDSAVIFSVLDNRRPDLNDLPEDGEALKQLVRECWDADSSNRPTAHLVCQRLAKEANKTPQKGWTEWIFHCMRRFFGY